MLNTPEERALVIGQYIVDHHATVREAAKVFGVSKSTVHKDVTQRLEHYNHALFLQVQALMELNKAERHIRGGLATQAKYKKHM